MKTFKYFALLGLLGTLVLTACSDDSSKKDGNQPSAPRVRWDSIPAEYSPRVESFNLQTQQIEKIKMDLFGFTGDVQIQYSDKLAADSATIDLFSVSKEAKYSLSGLNINEDTTYKTLNLSKYGAYECSIKIENSKITALKGACYIRALLTLPKGAEIEIYNVGKLISKRFFAMSNANFLKALDEASFQDNKMAVIETYLESYRITGKRPALSAYELGKAVEEFMQTEGKFFALRKLNAYVTDRENLSKMIEDKFSYFDREEARKICGL